MIFFDSYFLYIFTFSPCTEETREIDSLVSSFSVFFYFDYTLLKKEGEIYWEIQELSGIEDTSMIWEHQTNHSFKLHRILINWVLKIAILCWKYTTIH